MSNRIHYIDNIRAFVSIAIVLNHAIWSPFLFAHLDGAGEAVVAILREFSLNYSPLRVPFFFLIAGYFSYLALAKKPVGVFVRDRLLRLVLPLAIAVVSYKYIVVALLNFQDPARLLSFAAYVDYYRRGFHGFSYLWFLYNLIWFSGLTVLATLLLRAWPMASALLQRCGELVLSRKYVFIGLFCGWQLFLIAASLMRQRGWDVQIMFFPFWQLVNNVGYFAVGLAFALRPDRFTRLTQFRLGELALLVLAYAGLGIWGHVYGERIPFVLYSAISNALPLLLVVCAFRSVLNRRVGLLAKVANQSYPIYLIHMPLLSLLHLLLLRIGVPPMTVFAAAMVLIYPLSYGLAEAVRRSALLAPLFGTQKRIV